MNNPIFVMSFILPDSRKRKLEKDKILFKLSFLLLKKLGYEVHFYGDDNAIKEFSHIKWDYQDNYLEKINKNYYHTWSIGKLFSIQKAVENYNYFFHIDGDIFIFDRLPESILKSDIITLHTEKNYKFDSLLNNCKFLPLELNSRPTHAYNMSFFGGNSIILKKYITHCLNFILDEANSKYFQDKNQINTLLAILAEQGYFTCYADFFKINVKTIYENFNFFSEKIQHIRLQYSEISVNHYNDLEKFKKIIHTYNEYDGLNGIEQFDQFFNVI
jgi:hypothetical protein